MEEAIRNHCSIPLLLSERIYERLDQEKIEVLPKKWAIKKGDALKEVFRSLNSLVSIEQIHRYTWGIYMMSLGLPHLKVSTEMTKQ